jgi:hypothetical protein
MRWVGVEVGQVGRTGRGFIGFKVENEFGKSV